jgi:hypothetical protein
MPLAASSGPDQTLPNSTAPPKAAARAHICLMKILLSFAGCAVFSNRSGDRHIFNLL